MSHRAVLYYKMVKSVAVYSVEVVETLVGMRPVEAAACCIFCNAACRFIRKNSFDFSGMSQSFLEKSSSR